MNINLTLIGQAIAFAIFVWFCMKYVWPPIITAMEARKSTIADALASASRAEESKRLAEQESQVLITDAKEKANQIIQQAERRVHDMIAEAKNTARDEGARMKQNAYAEIDQEVDRARTVLQQQVAVLAIQGAERILQAEIDRDKHAVLLNTLVDEL